jgi:hypothetical protein
VISSKKFSAIKSFKTIQNIEIVNLKRVENVLHLMICWLLRSVTIFALTVTQISGKLDLLIAFNIKLNLTCATKENKKNLKKLIEKTRIDYLIENAETSSQLRWYFGQPRWRIRCLANHDFRPCCNPLNFQIYAIHDSSNVGICSVSQACW